MVINATVQLKKLKPVQLYITCAYKSKTPKYECRDKIMASVQKKIRLWLWQDLLK